MAFIAPTWRAGGSVDRTWALAALALLALLYGCTLIASPFDGNTDVSWLIFICEKVLAGQRLYVEIIELNPPMSVFLYLPPVWLAGRTGIAAELTVQAWVLLWAAISIAAVWRLSEAAGLATLAARRVFIAVIAYVLLVMPAHTFGEREHFALFGLLPYLMLNAARWTAGWTPGIRTTLPLGLLAGLAVCIKPHFALMVLGPSLWLFATTRRLTDLFSTENIVAGLTAVLYMCIVIVAYPEFFADVMRLNQLVYLPSTLDWRQLMGAAPTRVALLLIAIIVLLREQFTTPLSRVLLVAAGAGFTVYLIQAKGWPYHQLPTLGFGFAALAAAVVAQTSGGAARGRWTIAMMPPRDVVAILAAVLMLGIFAPRMFAARTDSRALEAEVRKISAAPTILIGSSNVGLHFPLVRRTNARWTSRLGSLWITEGAGRTLAKTADPKRREELWQLIRWDRDTFIAEAMAARPDILGMAYLDEDNTFLEWADQVPEFGRFLQGYRRIGAMNEIMLMVRRDLPDRRQQ